MARANDRSVAAIVGSAFCTGRAQLDGLVPHPVTTRWGTVELYRLAAADRPAYLVFRHGRPHRYLPHQIPYRALAQALRELNCGALLTTSSVGVLDAAIPLFRPLLVGDLLMLENRLPDGSPCTMFVEPRSDQGHLVLQEGLVSAALGEQVREICAAGGAPLAGEVIFGYVGGPRTKTAAENRLCARLGMQVNSMTLGPELVLACELEIPCVALVVGHKYSLGDDAPGGAAALDDRALAETLVRSREQLEQIVLAFLRRARPVPFANRIFRFGNP